MCDCCELESQGASPMRARRWTHTSAARTPPAGFELPRKQAAVAIAAESATGAMQPGGRTVARVAGTIVSILQPNPITHVVCVSMRDPVVGNWLQIWEGAQQGPGISRQQLGIGNVYLQHCQENCAAPAFSPAIPLDP